MRCDARDRLFIARCPFSVQCVCGSFFVLLPLFAVKWSVMCSLGLDCVMRSRVHLGWPDINSTRFAETYVWPQSSESAPRQQQRRRIQNQHELCICYVWTQWFAGRKLLNLGFLFGGESTHGQMNIRQNIAFHFANTHAIWKRSTLGRANVPNVHMHFIHLTQSECVCVWNWNYFVLVFRAISSEQCCCSPIPRPQPSAPGKHTQHVVAARPEKRIHV